MPGRLEIIKGKLWCRFSILSLSCAGSFHVDVVGATGLEEPVCDLELWLYEQRRLELNITGRVPVHKRDTVALRYDTRLYFVSFIFLLFNNLLCWPLPWLTWCQHHPY